MSNNLRKQNQVHPPKSNGVDGLGNTRRKLRLKDGESTMLLCEGITENAAKVLTTKIADFLKRNGLKMHGKWILTR